MAPASTTRLPPTATPPPWPPLSTPSWSSAMPVTRSPSWTAARPTPPPQPRSCPPRGPGGIWLCCGDRLEPRNAARMTTLTAALEALVAACNQGDLAGFNRLLLPEYFSYAPQPGEPSAPQALSEIAQALRDASPDLSVTL